MKRSRYAVSSQIIAWSASPSPTYANAISPQEWFEGTRMLAQKLTSSGVQTLFMRDTPHAPFAVPQCMARVAWRGSGNCDLTRSRALEQTVFGIEQAVAQTLPYVWNIDLSDQICGPERCEVVQGGCIILRDRDHLAASYVESLAPALAARIVPLISMNRPARGRHSRYNPGNCALLLNPA